MRCRHQKNVTVTEFGSSYTKHYIEKGLLTLHNSDFDNLTGVILVECQDCGFKKQYGRNRPKWVCHLHEYCISTESIDQKALNYLDFKRMIEESETAE